jgi:predicted permease
MSWLTRINAMLHRTRFHSEMEEELAFHIEAAERELIDTGMSKEEARRRVRLRFGSRDSVQERVYFESSPRLETTLHDVRFSLRLLRKSPVFTAVVLLSLALGIGANVAIFSVMNAVMLQSLPVRDPQSLVVLNSVVKGGFFPEKYVHDYEGSTYLDDKSGKEVGSSMPTVVFDAVRAHGTSFDDTFAFVANDQKVNVGLENRAESGTLQGVSGGYFGGLGVTPILGRMIAESDDDPAAPPVVVVGYKFFRNQLGGDESAIGRIITVNDTPAQVIGVAPPDFFGLDPTVVPDFWGTLSLYRAQWERGNNGDEKLDDPFVWWLTVAGRLKPGVSVSQARAETAVLFSQAIHAPDNAADVTVPSLRLEMGARGLGSVRRQYSSSLWLLVGISVLVLLIACANVAALLLSRATSRSRELATRLSLGASRGRLVRQLLTESLLLGLAGGILGVVLSRWITVLLLQLLENPRHSMGLAVKTNTTVLFFAFVVSVLCSVLVGVLPALRATDLSIGAALRQGQTIHSSRSGFRAGKLLVATQIALCFFLVVAAGLMVRTLNNLQRARLGFQADGLNSFTVRPGLNGYSKQRLLSYYDELLERMRAIHGVSGATYAQAGPIGEGISTSTVYIPGFNNPEQRWEYLRQIVGDGYFDTLGIPLLMGRAVGAQDTASSHKVVVINETMMRKYFRGENPLGRQIVTGSRVAPNICEVVGVAADVRYANIRDEIMPAFYVPFQQASFVSEDATFLLRNDSEPATLQRAVTATALQLNPDVPVVSFRREQAILTKHLSLERALARLSSAFALIGLLLACIGLYGTIAYMVGQRTGEIGVRLALGAGRATILRMILGDTLRVVATGLAVGIPLAWFASNGMKSQLYELTPHDSPTMLVTAGVILCVTLLAGTIPARRASKVEPVRALRHE